MVTGKESKKQTRGRAAERKQEGEKEADTGGWDSLNDSVLPFTFHTRTLLAPLGGGGAEEVCVVYVLFCSREKDGEIHSEDVIIIRLPCFGLKGGLKKDKHTQAAHTEGAHARNSRHTGTDMYRL